ncbi:MAG TPA: DUF2059 domain-containing protein [Caulobacter sp.]|nr:DUF2059 domain-containing protein [Caulobacter sp.]
MRRFLLAVGLTAAIALPPQGVLAQPQPTPVAAKAPPSARALDLSRRYFKAMRMDESMSNILDSIDPLLTSDGGSEDDEAMRQSTREALDAAMPVYIEKMVPVFAASYTEEELEALVTFYESPLGQSVVAKSRGMGGASSQAMKDLLPTILDDAMERYCARMSCEDPVEPMVRQQAS